ncbi:thiamine-phosphate kinase [Ningiella sp. W23]|uniref:thiamine-phosphate kinase n=1 Tax=Ningiella sp. W23 TaxID=3023715 RepID=UPI0037562E36
MDEFSIIERYFKQANSSRKDVIIGIGDDAAITQVPQGQYLATTTDTLLSGVHFLPDTLPDAIAHKAIAANLSDLAAMGAEPSWISLSVCMPNANDAWLSAFSEKVAQLCDYYSMQLIGGDMVKGPLAVTITAQGFVPPESIITRTGAKPGDWLFLTGTVGDAAAGLAYLQNKIQIAEQSKAQELSQRYFCPTPRVLVGTTLRRLASACIDVSDGLLQDLQHVLDGSSENGHGVGAIVHLDRLPISQALGSSIVELEQALAFACTGGDDYELLFTVSEEHRVSMETAMASYNLPITCIGQITGAASKLDLRLNEQPFSPSSFDKVGYQHF